MKTENIDLHPASAVATASLIKCVRRKKIDKDALIMLNITGGGEKKFSKENKLHYLEPKLIFDIDPDFKEVKKKLSNLF